MTAMREGEEGERSWEARVWGVRDVRDETVMGVNVVEDMVGGVDRTLRWGSRVDQVGPQ